MTTAATLLPEALALIQNAAAEGIELRLFGSLAIWHHCPRARQFAQARWNRGIVDIDLAGRSSQQSSVESLLVRWGFELHPGVRSMPDAARTVFRGRGGGLHGDIAYGRLRFSHDLLIEPRILCDAPTLPVAELLLLKLQIVDFAQRDLLDAAQLLADHEVADGDCDRINLHAVLASVLRDWGLAHSLDRNLLILLSAAQEGSLGTLPAEAQGRVIERATLLRDRLQSAPKPFRFRIRARLGEHVRWYNRVNEVGPW